MARRHLTARNLITAEWRAWARVSLAKLGRGSGARVAARVGCRSGQVSELLRPSARYSYLVPLVEHALVDLGAAPYYAPTAIDERVRYFLTAATDEQRDQLATLIDLFLTAPSSVHARSIRETLRAFRDEVARPMPKQRGK